MTQIAKRTLHYASPTITSTSERATNAIVFILSFFSFSGYYTGLALFISIGDISASRIYSVPIRLTVTFLALYLIIKNWSSIRRFHHPSLTICFLFFWTIYSFNVFANFSSEEYRINWYEYIFYAITYCIVPFFAFLSLPYHKYKKQILNGLLISGASLGAISIYLYGNLISSGISRISMLKYEDADAGFLSPLALSYSAALTISVSVIYLAYEKPTPAIRALIYLALPLSLFMFFLGASRGSVLAISATFIILIYYSSIKIKIRSLFFLALLIPSILAGASYTGSGVIERLMSTSEAIDTGSSSAARIDIWQETIKNFIASPIIGGKLEISGSYPHNIFLEILMNTGIIGGALILYPILFGLIKSINISRFQKNLFPLVFITQGLTQHMFSGSINNAILICMPLGIVLSIAACNERPGDVRS